MNKRILIFLLFFLMGKAVFSQTEDSLKKYSYKCYVYFFKNIHTGTCFFYKRHDKVYVVSNYHVFGGMDALEGKKSSKHIESIKIFILNKKNEPDSIILPPVNNIETFKFYEKPDLLAIRILDTTNLRINVINELIEKKYFKRHPMEYYLYGFSNSSNGVATIGNEQKIDFNSLKSTFSNISNSDTQFVHRRISETAFSINKSGNHGVSGSPVFGKFLENKKIVYRFMGVFFAFTEDGNSSICVKGKTAWEYLKSVN